MSENAIGGELQYIMCLYMYPHIWQEKTKAAFLDANGCYVWYFHYNYIMLYSKQRKIKF